EDGIRDFHVTGVQTCALPICATRSVDGQTQVAGLYFDSNIPDLFIDLLYQHGGSFYKEGGLEVDFADPAGIAAISFVNELYRSRSGERRGGQKADGAGSTAPG